MASQAAVKRAGETVPGKRGRGRPQGSANLTSEEKRLRPDAPTDYSRWNNTFQKPADFYAYLSGYPDKTGLLAYIYRLQPRIDVTLIGLEEVSIRRTKEESEMTEEFMAATFGRGIYKLTLNDANRPRGQKEVAHTFFELSSCPKPPVYDPRTLVLTEPKNLDEINRLINIGVMVRDRGTGQPRLRLQDDGTPFPTMPTPTSAPAAASPVGALDLNTVVATLLTRSASSPHETVKDTIEMARMLAPPQQDTATIVKMVVAELGGARQQDPWAVYERIDGILKARMPQAPAGSAIGSAMTNAAIDAGAPSWVPQLPAIFSEIRQMIPEVVSAWREMRSDAAQNGGGQQMQRQQKPLTVEQRIEQIARLGFQKMQEGVAGFDYAAYVCGFMPGGLEVYQLLEPQGAAGFIGLMAMNPQARTVVNDPQLRPQLEVFLTDFFTFDPSGSSAEAEPSEPAA